MRIIEILLPKTITDRGLSSQSYRTIDKLQSRMNHYVDKICNMAAGTARDFLKSKLKADYISLKDIIQKTSISEAVHKLPLTPKDFDLVKHIMERPIPAAIAPIYIMEIIDDDELTDQFKSLEESDPGRDVRPLIVDWFNRVMPDQMYHFGQQMASDRLNKGTLSLIHGYDPKECKGSNEPITGNAYGAA